MSDVFLDELRHAANEDESAGHHLQADYIRQAATEIERLRTELAAAEARGIAVGLEQRGVVGEIAAERARQVAAEGWSSQHDDTHVRGEMAKAAAAYADHAARFGDAERLGFEYAIKAPNPLWPWDRGWWKPSTPRRDLIKAAALIVAEIERLDRALPHEPIKGDEGRGWHLIETYPVPRDGSWFAICCEGEPDSIEAGCFDPLRYDRFEEVPGGLYKKVQETGYEWTGINNMHRATHWCPIPSTPTRPAQIGPDGAGERREGA